LLISERNRIIKPLNIKVPAEAAAYIIYTGIYRKAKAFKLHTAMLLTFFSMEKNLNREKTKYFQ
jgi:hypothetical protein